MWTGGQVLAGALLLVAAMGGAPPAAASVWPSSQQRIARALGQGDAAARRRAAAQLLDLPPRLAAAWATRALADDDTEVKLFAARAVTALAVDRAGDRVIGWLADRDVRLRVAACEVIAAAPTERSVQALARVLGDAQSGVRLAATRAMGDSGMLAVVSPLLGHLDDQAVAVRLEVVRALGRLGEVRAVVPLVSKLQDQEEQVRREAARALGRLGDVRAAASLLLALQDRSVAVRVQAIAALGRLRAPDATAAIAALLSSNDALGGATDGVLRQTALAALGRIATPEAIALLIQALAVEGPQPLSGHLRAPVRQALMTAGKPAARALTAVLGSSPSPRLAAAAVLTLAVMHRRSVGGAIVRVAQRGVAPLDASLQALATLGDRQTLPFVLEHLDHADGRIRQLAVTAASELLDPADHDGRAIDVVRRRVMDLTAPLGERVAVVRLLGRTGSTRALPLLLPLSKSERVPLRVAAVEAMGVLGLASPKVDRALLAALAAPSEGVRVAAATALGKVGADAAAAKLLHLLAVSAEQDRGALGIAVSGVLGRSHDPALVRRVGALMASVSGPLRDALIEGLGRMSVMQAGALLNRLRRRVDADDRRKIAEALGGQPGQAGALGAMLRDPDPTVRAAATWSLGKIGKARAVGALLALLGDLDAAVAGNAALAVGKVAARTGAPERVTKTLCGVFADARPYVRALALAGLGRFGGRCAGGLVGQRLQRDRAPRVRLAAARLLWQQAAEPGAVGVATRRALARCAGEDHDAEVAAACATRPMVPTGTAGVLVYVVPAGRTEPVPRAPYALVFADGSMRLGVADRRGAVYEGRAPAGHLELAVPAALAR